MMFIHLTKLLVPGGFSGLTVRPLNYVGLPQGS